MKRLMILAPFISLMACANAEISTPPVTVVPKDRAAAVGIDVYGRARAAGNPVPRFRGQETVQIRTWGNGEQGRTELTGVPCLIDSGTYAANFTTPANVIVPDYGPNSPALFVRCETETQSGSITVNVYNATNQQRQQSAAGAGVLGAMIIGAVAAANTDNETDDFTYPALTVNLKKKKD